MKAYEFRCPCGEWLKARAVRMGLLGRGSWPTVRLRLHSEGLTRLEFQTTIADETDRMFLSVEEQRAILDKAASEYRRLFGADSVREVE